MTSFIKVPKDKLKGLIYGGALGDALGAPHEFRTVNNGEYTGIIHLPTRLPGRLQHHILPIGATTDDTNMHMVLMKNLIKNNGEYVKNDVILEYINWAQTEKCLGHNTRKLFKNSKTLKAYSRAITKVGDDCQSNGSMMRCGILALYNDDVIIEDCCVSNPNLVNVECNLILLRLIRNIMNNKHNKDKFCEFIQIYAGPEPVKDALFMALNKEIRNVAHQKGWVCHALYCAIYVFLHIDKYEEAMDFIIKLGGDTDTNAAIAGYLMGALCGYEKMCQNDRTRENIEKLLVEKNEIEEICAFYSL